MKILVINCGSSSLKYQLFDMENETVLAKGNCEKIGNADSFIGGSVNGEKFETPVLMSNHTEAFLQVKKALTEGDYKVIDDLGEISAIGHRVVQGGALFNESMLVTDKVIEGIEVVDEIANVPTSKNDRPKEDVVIKSITIVD